MAEMSLGYVKDKYLYLIPLTMFSWNFANTLHGICIIDFAKKRDRSLNKLVSYKCDIYVQNIKYNMIAHKTILPILIYYGQIMLLFQFMAESTLYQVN